MKTTKSLRLGDDEIQELKIVGKTLRLPSESALLQRIFADGLRLVKADAAVQLYVNEGKTLGETAQQLNMPVDQVMEILTIRHVKIMDIPVDLMEKNLLRATRLLGLSIPNLPDGT